VPPGKPKPVWREYAEAIAISLVLALLIRTFIIQAFKIPSGSMIPTLLVGDHLLVNKFVYRFHPPRRGDIVVFKFPQDRKTDFIKRVVAQEGDTVELVNRTLLVNGLKQFEPYTQYEKPSSLDSHFGPVTVPRGKIFVMGDNRDNSYDSRYWGPVAVKDVVGKALVIYWSWGGSLLNKERWKRIGDRIR
jgi:signal peptidase I